MFIAHVFGPLNEAGEPSSEMLFDLKSPSLEEAKNELFSYFSLVPGYTGYYAASDLGSAKIMEVVRSEQLDVEAQKMSVAVKEAQMLAEQEEELERARFEHASKKRHKVRR